MFPFEAESISYAVCKYFGIETGENSFGYIASWSQGKELKELRASLETINKTSGTLISDIERHYKEICKERGIDLHAKAEPETAPIEQPTGNLTYYVAECMEFSNLGEYHDNLSLEEAVRIYQEIPAERMNGIKGIGFELKDGSDYEGPFPILTGQTIDLDTIQAIDYYRDNPLVQKAVKELAAAMPEMEVLGADANQQEALFLIDDATYLHIQPCDSGWDYTLYDAASMKELDGGQLDMPELSRKNAVLQICDDNNLDSTSLRHAPMSMIETLQEAAYARWAKVFNLKQMAQTMNYLSENNLLEYAVLEEKAAAATAHHNELSAQIKAAEKRMAEIAVLRTHIVNYAKTREVYVAYRKAGYSKKFREEHEQEMLLHQAEKNAFDDMGVKKLPKVKELQAEYARLLEEKKKTYAEYRRSREEMRELLAAKANMDRLLKMDEEQKKEQEKDHDQR